MSSCRSALPRALLLLALIVVTSFCASAADPPLVPAPLAEPFATESVIKHPKVIGWQQGKTPQAPAGFHVDAYTREIENPRWIYVLPNGDILVSQARTMLAGKAAAEANPGDAKLRQMLEGLQASRTVTGTSPNRITLLRDADGDGRPEMLDVFVEGLHQPFGMALVGNTFYVGCTDAVLAFDYRDGQTQLTGKGRKIVDLPAGGYNNHWTRNLLVDPRARKLYISVGSASNVAEHGMAVEHHRANILQCNLDGSGLRVFAAGLRNPVGMAWNRTSGALWTAVNERDELGDELVPDYLTHVQDGGFYGWPYSYFGQHEDPRRKGERPDLVKQAIVPDVALGSHTASLGLAFYDAFDFPRHYQGGAFIGQRGSWNRSKFAGYHVAFVPFKDGKPVAGPEEFLTGFIANDREVHGRPVGVAVAADGSLLVADEPSNIVWKVTAEYQP